MAEVKGRPQSFRGGTGLAAGTLHAPPRPHVPEDALESFLPGSLLRRPPPSAALERNEAFLLRNDTRL